MAVPVIIAVNLTVTPVDLGNLGALVPSLGQFTLSNANTTFEIQNDRQLIAALDAGTLALMVDGTLLSASQSAAYATPGKPDASPVRNNFTAILNPTATADAAAGYFAGSLWLNTVSQAVFTCVNATNNAAVWVSSVVAYGSPVTVGTANAPGTNNTAARSDHVHAHGSLAGGTLHANATNSVAGFMSAADKAKLDATIFGNNYQYVENLAESTTTSASYQTKFTLVTPALTGIYRVQWNATVGMNTTQRSVFVRCQNITDNDPVSGEFNQEPKDSTDEIAIMGFELVTFTGSSKTFAMQWRSEAQGYTARISNSRIEIFRVS